MRPPLFQRTCDPVPDGTGGLTKPMNRVRAADDRCRAEDKGVHAGAGEKACDWR